MATQTAPATVRKTVPASAPAKAPVKAPAAAPVKAPAAAPVKAPAAAPVKAPVAPAKTVAKAPAATAPDATTAPKKPKAERTMEEELEMAVNGTLEPRKERGTTEQESLLARAANGRPVGRPKGITTGLTIQMCWMFLFQQNEKAPANPAKVEADGVAIPGSGKMTDAQITAFMTREFPGRENNTFKSPAMARRIVLNGGATRGMKPRWKTVPYGEDAKEAPAKQIGEGLKKANEARRAAKAAAVAEAPAEADEAEEAEAEEEVEADA